MFYFQNDYNAMCHPKVMEKMQLAASVRMDGYGQDDACLKAAAMIRELCGDDSLSVHFLTGGTQTNLTVIAASLRPYQAVISATSAHINEHETGAIQATGHQILTLPTSDGKITAEQIDNLAANHYISTGPGVEHSAQPKLVYISFSTELGTIYSKQELEAIRSVCDKYGMYLYIDGARLGYGLCAADCDLTIQDITRLSDVFYIGGTKQGTLFGEAVVIRNPAIAEDFRYMIKRQGGMLAKGWLLGLQFQALLEDDLYFTAARAANGYADQLRSLLSSLGCALPGYNHTNQVFTVLSDGTLDKLAVDFRFTEWCRADENHRMVRFCTSWSTTQSDLDALCDALRSLVGSDNKWEVSEWK